MSQLAEDSTETSGQQPSEALVRRYYQRVDAHDVEALLECFSADASYRRQGTDPIHGKGALRRFYESERVIESGVHQLDDVLVGAEWVAVRGTFCGRLRTGEDVQVGFTDWHHVVGGVIDRRETLFPSRQI
jgi:ketosteroid isomerase-like protein